MSEPCKTPEEVLFRLDPQFAVVVFQVFEHLFTVVDVFTVGDTESVRETHVLKSLKQIIQSHPLPLLDETSLLLLLFFIQASVDSE